MHKLLLVLVLPALVAADTVKPACQWNSPMYLKCQSDLGTRLQLNDSTTPLMFKDYTILYNQLLWFWGNPYGTDGPLLACNSLEQFRGCLYSSNNAGCMNLQNLADNTDISNSWMIDGTLSQYTLNCGPGLNTLYHEGLECAQRIVNGYSNTLKKCVSSYKSSVSALPSQGCSYLNTLINCWSAPFGASSLQNCLTEQSAVLWWTCEANRQFGYDQFPNCGIQCDAKLQQKNVAAHLLTHHKVIDGEHWFKIPDYHALEDGKVVLVEGPWMNN